jgi:hypothetical protein
LSKQGKINVDFPEDRKRILSLERKIAIERLKARVYILHLGRYL